MKRICPILLGLAALTGCEEPVCTEIAMSSVTVQLLDPSGQPILGAQVQYSVEDALSDCFEWDDGWYACGYEEEGDITVLASAEGYLDAEGSVFVEADECHVVTESLTLTLEPDDVACTQEVRYAVDVTVVDLYGLPVEADVTWSLPNADMAPQPCEGGDGHYFCREGAAGQLEIWATDELSFASALVEVSADDCGPVTEYIELTLGTCG